MKLGLKKLFGGQHKLKSSNKAETFVISEVSEEHQKDNNNHQDTKESMTVTSDEDMIIAKNDRADNIIQDVTLPDTSPSSNDNDHEDNPGVDPASSVSSVSSVSSSNSTPNSKLLDDNKSKNSVPGADDNKLLINNDYMVERDRSFSAFLELTSFVGNFVALENDKNLSKGEEPCNDINNHANDLQQQGEEDVQNKKEAFDSDHDYNSMEEKNNDEDGNETNENTALPREAESQLSEDDIIQQAQDQPPLSLPSELSEDVDCHSKSEEHSRSSKPKLFKFLRHFYPKKKPPPQEEQQQQYEDHKEENHHINNNNDNEKDHYSKTKEKDNEDNDKDDFADILPGSTFEEEEEKDDDCETSSYTDTDYWSLLASTTDEEMSSQGANTTTSTIEDKTMILQDSTDQPTTTTTTMVKGDADHDATIAAQGCCHLFESTGLISVIFDFFSGDKDKGEEQEDDSGLVFHCSHCHQPLVEESDTNILCCNKNGSTVWFHKECYDLCLQEEEDREMVEV